MIPDGSCLVELFATNYFTPSDTLTDGRCSVAPQPLGSLWSSDRRLKRDRSSLRAMDGGFFLVHLNKQRKQEGSTLFTTC